MKLVDSWIVPARVGRSWRIALVLLSLLGGSAALWADDSEAAKDALIVETLLRLDKLDLDAKPKTKAAVLRYLQAHPGSDQFFQLIERFQIADADVVLLDLAVAKPGETAGVKAAQLLLALEAKRVERQDRIGETLAGDDSARAAALIGALGNVGGDAVLARLKPLVTDAKRPLAVRSAAVGALGKSDGGQQFLLELARGKQIPPDLTFAAANALFASASSAVRDEAAKYLKLPASADAKPLPPLAELVKMPGDAARGKALFNDKATCSKCHIVAGVGREVGPNLTEIGTKLSKEALLVSILDPSAGISHNYESYLAVTEDGKTISGLLVSKTDELVVLKDATGIVHELKAPEIEEFRKLETSLMPADLQKLLSAQELVDVVEYLMTLKKA
jgi:putative heme-binding domain-containing protein